ncbi:MAG TPA: hypothetical protein DCM28_22765 [Phycisphaerales bacterium]|nr:hypothetical protein [Phycisphaerales bacterium]HCD34425.1 hypothetical protein [Phycisphaerales bacterium]|tara:strand:+ start:1524 stop:1814 length:291 start_codon:yes stop_codon:yes gene_type:complete
MEATKAAKKIEMIVQSVLGLAIVAVLSFFIAVQAGAFDQSDKIAEFAKPLTGNDVVKMLTSNEAQLRTRYQNYDKMLSRAREAGARPFFQGVSQEN